MFNSYKYDLVAPYSGPESPPWPNALRESIVKKLRFDPAPLV